MVVMCPRLVTVIIIGVLVLNTVVNCANEEIVDSSRSSRDFIPDEPLRAVDHEKWRSMEYPVTENQDWVPADGSIAASATVADEEEAVLKRRRPGRKRKRRPQNFDREYQHDDDPYVERIAARSRPRRPQRLDQRRDQWRDEMLAEEPFRPMRNYNRRRLYPKYEEDTSAKTEDSYGNGNKDEDLQFRSSQTVQNDERRSESVVEKVRDPYTALNQDQGHRRRPYSKRKYPTKHDDEEEEERSTDKPDGGSAKALDLKALLKQSGGISLSELLQQKNLSLADLLKGEQHAISALSEIPEQASEANKHAHRLSQDDDDDDDDKPKRYNFSGHRRLPSIRKKAKQQEEEFTTVRENLLPQKKRIPFNGDNMENHPMVSEFELHDMPMEITTERRIFVPSHPKYYTSVDYKPIIKDLSTDKTTESIISTTTAPAEKTSESFSIVSSTVTFSTSENPTTVKSKNHYKVRPLNPLPPTLAKLKKTTMKSTVANTATENYSKLTSIPPKAIKINLNELFGVTKVLATTEGPMKISVNIDQLFQLPDRNEPESNLVITDSNKYGKKDGERIVPLNAKDEIMEILSDSVSRQHLTRLLKLRNMTVDELVEQRERGSSQKHLADIFHNQTKEPEPAEEVVVAQIIKDSPPSEKSFGDPPALFETFPVFKQRPLGNGASDESQYYTSVIELPSKTRESRQNQLPAKQSADYNFIGNPLFGSTGGQSKEIFGKFVPVWSQAYTNANKHTNAHSSGKMTEDELVMNEEAKRIEEIENKLAEAVNGVLNIEVNNRKPYIEKLEEENEFFRLPYGVRSAIIASAIIGGISLLIFLTIFIIFKWTQRQRIKQLTYSNSFSSSKIKSPILETQFQGRIFGNLMNATLGRKKKLPTISSSEPQSLQDYLWDNDRKPFQ